MADLTLRLAVYLCSFACAFLLSVAVAITFLPEARVYLTENKGIIAISTVAGGTVFHLNRQDKFMKDALLISASWQKG
jgi:hypothetical protein